MRDNLRMKPSELPSLTAQRALALIRFMKAHPQEAKALITAEKKWRERVRREKSGVTPNGDDVSEPIPDSVAKAQNRLD